MQLGRMEDLWILAGRTRQAYPFILAGCLSAPQSDRKIFDLALAIHSLSIPAACHPVTLDLLLANSLQTAATPFSLAGCTIQVPGVPACSGGILGDPNSSPASAGGLIESLPGQWSLVTFPGSPGMAQNITITCLPPEIQALCTHNTPDHRTLQHLSAYTNKLGADKFVAITDGSGPDARGAALIRYQDQELLWRLDEVK
ncbi:MAG: hypothetical protein H6Q65_1108 [Firmicutes bacterium]|nr:hypothetical protein [Bacillota bacterium]